MVDGIHERVVPMERPAIGHGLAIDIPIAGAERLLGFGRREEGLPGAEVPSVQDGAPRHGERWSDREQRDWSE